MALDQFEAHPIAGGGAGTYRGYWLVHRPLPIYVANAHSLYLETLAEEGVVGLAALLLFLALPSHSPFGSEVRQKSLWPRVRTSPT